MKHYFVENANFPKPIECIEVKIKDHYFVPPVIIKGDIVTSFQYLTLHDSKHFSEESEFLNFVYLLNQKKIKNNFHKIRLKIQ